MAPRLKVNHLSVHCVWRATSGRGTNIHMCWLGLTRFDLARRPSASGIFHFQYNRATCLRVCLQLMWKFLSLKIFHNENPLLSSYLKAFIMNQKRLHSSYTKAGYELRAMLRMFSPFPVCNAKLSWLVYSTQWDQVLCNCEKCRFFLLFFQLNLYSPVLKSVMLAGSMLTSWGAINQSTVASLTVLHT